MSMHLPDEMVEIIRDTLADTFPDLIPDDYIDTQARVVAESLARRLGGIILDPTLRGLAIVYTLDGRPARELYLDAPEGEVWTGPLVQVATDAGWVDLEESA